MRHSLLPLFRCPRCRRGRLAPEVAEARQIDFGPLTCDACHHGFAVAEGVVDLGPHEVAPHHGPARRVFESTLLARSWRRVVRPSLLALGGGRALDLEAEAALVRGLLNEPKGPILDVGCGTGALLRALSRRTELPPLIGLDVSRAMLEEALNHSREEGVPLSLVRAQAPELPFQDGVLGGVVQSGSLAAMDDPDALFAEVHRILRPGGRYVLLEWLRVPALLSGRLGLTSREPAVLRAALSKAGFTRIELVDVKPYRVFQASRD